MKTKNFSLMIVGLLSSILLVSLASAAFDVSPTSLTFNQNTASKTFTVTNPSTTVPLTVSVPTTLTIGAYTFTITGDTTTPILSTAPRTFTITSPSNLATDLDFGERATGTLTVTDATNSSITKTISIILDNSEYCELGNKGDLDIDVQLTNKGTIGEEDTEWYLFDNLEAEIQVDNNANEDIDNIIVQWGLYDKTSGKFIFDEEENDFNLKDGKSKTIIVKFTLDPDDFKDLDGDYVFLVKAFSDDSDWGEDKQCVSDSQAITMASEDDLVILGNIKLPATTSCGTDVQITAEVWNIGADDQSNVKVRVEVPDLKINKIVEIGDIDSLDNDKFDTTISIPEDAEEKSYTVKLTVLNEDSDVYISEDTDREAIYTITLPVSGSCNLEPEVAISATLESGGKAGQDLIVKVTVTNTGEESETFKIELDNFAEWASEAEANPNTVIVPAGSSQEVTITLAVRPDVEGEKSFDINVLSGEETIFSQPVTASITKSGFGGINLSGNWYLWAIGALNIILVIIIIAVAIRVARK